MHRIWFEREPQPEHLALLDGAALPLGPGPSDDPFRELGEADAIVASVYVYGADVMDLAPRAQVICRTGIGYDKVDLAAATLRGIVVCNTPDGPTISTAEHAVALMLAVAKQLQAAAAVLRAGGGDFFARHHGMELHGRTLGLVGLGRTGGRVAAVAAALGMQVRAFDPYAPPGRAAALGVEGAGSLEALLAAADVVSLHVPLTEETRGLMDAARFSAMRPGSIFVNTARGGLVDHEALLRALEEGPLAGAGLDVTEPEPLDPSHPLLHRDDVIVTPHVASATVAGKDRIYRQAIAQALQVLRGERPPHLVNPEVWDRRRTATAR